MSEGLKQIILELAKRERLLTAEAKKLLEEIDQEKLGLIRAKLFKSSEKTTFVTVEEIKKLLSEESRKEVEEVPSVRLFQPIAKDIQPKIKVLKNPGARLNKKLRAKDITDMLKDRLDKLSKVIAKKLRIKSVAPIKEILKSRNSSSIVIGVLSGKKERKNGIILEVEDSTGKIICFVSKDRNQKVYENTLKLPLDSVIGLRIKKIRSNFCNVEDIILPETKKKDIKRSDEEVYLVLTSDLHIGSKMFLEKVFDRFIAWLNGKYGNKQMLDIASKVKYITIAGDIVDGIGVFPKQEEQLEEIKVEKQYEKAAKLIERIPDYIEILILPGNHDATLSTLPQPPIWKEYADSLYRLPNVHMVGNPVNVCLHEVNVLSFHGESLEDIITCTPGLSKEKISEAMKILLKTMHISPTYGGKTKLLPLSNDELVIYSHPDVFHAGHIHINDHQKYNGTIIVNSGTWQAQTEYQKERGWVPTPGKVPVINLKTSEIKILSFV